MANDIWLSGGWLVNSAGGPGQIYFKPAGRPGTFKLRDIPDSESGDTAFYRVDSSNFDMPDCWRNARFYPVGRVAASLPGPKKLQPWSSDTEDDWNNAATSVRAAYKNNPDLKRLEATIQPVGYPETLILILVEKAVADGSCLLVLQLNGAPLPVGQVAALEDGTAHGTGPSH